MWNRLRIVLFRLRRGVLKRRTLMQEDLQVLRKRGFKVFPKNLQLFYPHHITASPRVFGLHDYEFSCSNSPANPPLHLTKKRLIAAQHCFPCIQPYTVESPASWLEQMNRIQSCEEVSSMETYQLGPGEELNTLMPPEAAGQVDIEAEEFIERFINRSNSSAKFLCCSTRRCLPEVLLEFRSCVNDAKVSSVKKHIVRL